MVFVRDICGPLFFLFDTNNLPKIIKINSKPVLFADYTRLIITIASPLDFKKGITTAFVQLKKWFNANSLFLNDEKTHYIHFMTKSVYFICKVVGYNNNFITRPLTPPCSIGLM